MSSAENHQHQLAAGQKASEIVKKLITIFFAIMSTFGSVCVSGREWSCQILHVGRGSFVVKLNATREKFVGILMSALDTKNSIISAKFP